MPSGSGLGHAKPLLYDLSRAIATSLELNLAELSTTPTQNARLRKGYHQHNPSPDGNCLFHALARAFPDLGTHRDTRQAVGAANTAIQFAARAFNINIIAYIETCEPRDLPSENPDENTRTMSLARSQDHFFLMETINNE